MAKNLKIANSSQVRPSADEASVAANEGFSGKEYNAVAHAANLRSINLLRSAMMSNPAQFDAAEAISLSLGRELQSCQFDPETQVAAAIFKFSILAKAGRKKAFSCSCEYAVVYQMPADATEAAATGFCRNVGGFAAYPYFRALAAQMAWNAGIELPPLPSIAAMPIVPK